MTVVCCLGRLGRWLQRKLCEIEGKLWCIGGIQNEVETVFKGRGGVRYAE